MNVLGDEWGSKARDQGSARSRALGEALRWGNGEAAGYARLREWKNINDPADGVPMRVHARWTLSILGPLMLFHSLRRA